MTLFGIYIAKNPTITSKFSFFLKPVLVAIVYRHQLNYDINTLMKTSKRIELNFDRIKKLGYIKIFFYCVDFFVKIKKSTQNSQNSKNSQNL